MTTEKTTEPSTAADRPTPRPADDLVCYVDGKVATEAEAIAAANTRMGIGQGELIPSEPPPCPHCNDAPEVPCGHCQPDVAEREMRWADVHVAYATRLACAFCERRATPAEAMAAGWEPYFWFTAHGTEHNSEAAACTACTARWLIADPEDRGDGMVLAPLEPVPASTRLIDRLLAGINPVGPAAAEAHDAYLAEHGELSPGPRSDDDGEAPTTSRAAPAIPHECYFVGTGATRPHCPICRREPATMPKQSPAVVPPRLRSAETGAPDQAYIDRVYSAAQLLLDAGGLCVGYVLDEEMMSGSWCWSPVDGGDDVVFYATPWWEGEREIPLQITDADGNAIIGSLGTIVATGNVDSDAREYLARVHQFLAMINALAVRK